MAYNNRYFNPNNPRPFQLDSVSWKPDPKDTFGTLAEWKKQSTQPNFEAGSAWGQTAPRNYTPPRSFWRNRRAVPGRSSWAQT
jgi:hypothetical protein